MSSLSCLRSASVLVCSYFSPNKTMASAQRQYLIQNGVLQRGLGGLESQVRLQVPGVACMRASSWNRPAIDRMANINIEPGETDFASLIGHIQQGSLGPESCNHVDDRPWPPPIMRSPARSPRKEKRSSTQDEQGTYDDFHEIILTGCC